VSLFEEGLRSGLRFGVTGWTCLLSAYTEHGMMKEAQATFERMTAAGVAPDEVTVLCLLNAASHAGLGLGVRQLYGDLQARFPALQLGPWHRTCVVDGLARAGLLDEAVAEARELEYFVAWVAVLGGARSHARLDIGELALKELCRLNPDNATLASAHVLMSHMYTAHGRDEEAAQMRRAMKDEGLHKLPGESSIEVSGVMHAFRVGDTSHPEMQQIVAMNDELHERLRAAGYVADIAWASRDANTPDQTKEQLLCEHSERLALVYGLLHSAEGQPLTIFKNLRVCGDCHNATKHASKVLTRKLVVKDMNRWHVFEDGKCSCGDFW
jgi:pentatricopeptide repeat protein